MAVQALVDWQGLGFRPRRACSPGPWAAGCSAASRAQAGESARCAAGADLVGAKLAFDFGLDGIEAALQAADPQAGHARSARQAVRAEHQQGDQADQQQLGKADIEHGSDSVLAQRLFDLLRLAVDGVRLQRRGL